MRISKDGCKKNKEEGMTQETKIFHACVNPLLQIYILLSSIRFRENPNYYSNYNTEGEVMAIVRFGMIQMERILCTNSS